MRKRDLLLGLALCGLTSVFAQQPLFVYDFDHDGQDSLNGDGHLVYGNDTVWANIQCAQDIVWRNSEAQRDCTILIYKATYSNYVEEGAQTQDYWEIVPEEGNPENNVFHLVTGDGKKGSNAYGGGIADYERVLRLYFPDGIVKDNSSYRISYRVKANSNAKSQLFVVRGIDYNDVRWQYKNGSAQGDQAVEITDFNPELWTNASGVFFYLTDSLMEAVAKTRASWWTDSWKDAAGIYQPNIHRMQAWFPTESSEYFVDDISLYKSYIGGAESNQDIIRVNFGYQTNGAALAAATPFGAIDLLEEDPEAVSIVGYWEGEPEQVAVRWAEFHTDGYLYIWADLEDGQDLTEEYYDSVFLSFNNPMQNFVYNGNVYPNALDEEYSKTKVVLGFQNELVIPSARAFNVSSITQQPPTFVSVEPETGSFNLSLAEDNVFKFKFSKPVYIGEEGASIRLEGAGLGDGKELVLSQDPDDETGVIATLPASIKELNGDYTMVVSCIAVEKGAQTSEPVSLTYTYGDATGQAMVEYLNSNWWLKLGANTLPLGWQFGDVRIGDSYIDADGNAQNVTTHSSGIRLLDNGASAIYKQTIYFCNRDGAKSMIYGKQEGSKLHLAPGSYYITAPLGVHDGNGAEGADSKITVYGLEDNTNVALAPTAMKIGGDRQSANPFAENKFMFTVATEGDYVIEISCEVGTPKGVALAPVSVTNVYSAAYGYVKDLNDQLAINKQLVEDNAEAYAANQLYKAFAANYNENATWSAKQPKQYQAKVQELKDQAAAFNALLKSVADFDAALKNANDVISQNAEGPLASFDEFVNLKGLAAQYASYDAFNSSTEDNNVATAALKSSADGFMILVKGVDFYQVQPKALSALADSLKFDWSSLPEGENSIAAKIAAQTGHNVDFINVLKTAVTWGIYKKFAQNDLSWMPTKEIEDTLGNITEVPYLDVTTAFIFNPLWCTTHKGDNHIGGYNEMPGWTLSGFDLGNVGDRYYGHAWYNASATDADPFHDSQLGAGWNNGMWATQEISNVPAGQYSIGLGNVTENDSWSVRIKSADSTYLEFKCDINGNWQADPNQFVTFGTLVLDVDNFTFQAGQDGFGGWSQADHPQMILTGLADGFNYVAAEAAMADKFQKAVETIAEEIEGQANGPVVGINGVIYNNEAEAQGFYIKEGAVYFNK